MTLESQCVSLELSKRLKELGVKSESLFSWHDAFRNEDGSVDWKVDWSGPLREDLKVYPAYSVAELGEILPATITVNADWKILTVYHVHGGWMYYYSNDESCLAKDAIPEKAEVCEKEADARALMLIHLLENNLLTPHVEGKM